jgi:ABC-type transport system substrate-binding protein
MWKKNLGVEAKLQNQEWKTMLDTMHTHNFDAVRYAWIADYDDAATFLNNFRTGDSENTSQYSNPDYDQALVNAAKAKTTQERGQFYQQAEDLLGRDVPAIPVYHYVRTHLVKPWVGDLRRISWGITTPKICTSKNTKRERHVVLIKWSMRCQFNRLNTFWLFLSERSNHFTECSEVFIVRLT